VRVYRARPIFAWVHTRTGQYNEVLRTIPYFKNQIPSHFLSSISFGIYGLGRIMRIFGRIFSAFQKISRIEFSGSFDRNNSSNWPRIFEVTFLYQLLESNSLITRTPEFVWQLSKFAQLIKMYYIKWKSKNLFIDSSSLTSDKKFVKIRTVLKPDQKSYSLFLAYYHRTVQEWRKCNKKPFSSLNKHAI
jgi:hypothetical protein